MFLSTSSAAALLTPSAHDALALSLFSYVTDTVMTRFVLAFILSCVVASISAMQPMLAPSSGAAQERAVAQTKTLLASVTASMTKQQAELDVALADASARAGWSAQDRAKFFQTIFNSPTNQAFERQIASLTRELRGMLKERQNGRINDPQANARYVEDVRARVDRLGAIYDQQSAYLIGQLSQVRSKDHSRTR